MGGGYVRDIVFQAEEVAQAQGALRRRCSQDVRLADGGRRRDFGRTAGPQANLGHAGRGRSRPAVCEELPLRVVMVIFVLRPLTQFFMQEYREGVRNEYYNVQLTPLPRLRPL